MKWFRCIYMSILILPLLIMLAGTTVSAKEKYTYTVRVFPGNQGEITGEGIQLTGSSNASIRPVYEESDSSVIAYMEISGIEFADDAEAVLYINPNEIVDVTDDAYRVIGVRRAGRDNEDAKATGPVDRDMDYVIAYGTRNENPVNYTVNYQDAAGNALLPSSILEGNPFERQYVSARYVDGYLPQAYNMVKTLSENPEENVFTFIYTPVETGTEESGTGTGTAGTGTTGTGTTAGTTGGNGTTAGTAGGAGTTAGTTGETSTAGADDTGTQAGAGEADDGVDLPDEDIPQDDGPRDLVDLDDEEVPLANMSPERTGGTVIGYLPVYIGISAAAVLMLIGVAVFLKKRKKVPVQELLQKHPDDEK